MLICLGYRTSIDKSTRGFGVGRGGGRVGVGVKGGYHVAKDVQIPSCQI